MRRLADLLLGLGLGILIGAVLASEREEGESPKDHVPRNEISMEALEGLLEQLNSEPKYAAPSAPPPAQKSYSARAIVEKVREPSVPTIEEDWTAYDRGDPEQPSRTVYTGQGSIRIRGIRGDRKGEA